jgi:hypothetical protein
LDKPIQMEDAEAPHYVGASFSRAESDVRLTSERLGLDNKSSRFPHVARLTVHGEPLLEGDTVTVEFRNTTAPFLAGAGSIRAAVDRRGYGEYDLMEHEATYVIRPGPPERVQLTAPSQATVGEPVEFAISIFDRFFNPVDPDAHFEISGLDDTSLAGSSPARFWTPVKEGFIWPKLLVTLEHQGETATSLAADGNPILVSQTRADQQIFWGDLHSHSAISKDALGSRHFEYARDVAHLDFFAATEHSDDDRDEAVEQNGIKANEWEFVRRQARDLYEPGRFATLLGYECTLKEGHRCVFSRDDTLVPWTPLQLGQKIDRLWNRMRPGSEMTIPHHLGRMTHARRPQAKGPGLDDVIYLHDRTQWGGPLIRWNVPIDRTFDQTLEIYSAHGTSEMFDPEDPLAYENVLYAPSRSGPGRHYARDAWAAGFRHGVIAASDNHSAQPGQPHLGLTAVIAPGLSRETVFDAIANRQSYATTGERVYLQFSLAGVPMGGTTQATGTLQGRALVEAPRDLAFVEIVRLRLGDESWETVARWDAPGPLLDATFDDSSDTESRTTRVYYQRA